MNRRSQGAQRQQAALDEVRRKARLLLRDYGKCPRCGLRGTLASSLQPEAGMLVFRVYCLPPGCGWEEYYPSTYLEQLGSIADRARHGFELNQKLNKAEVASMRREKVRKEMFGFTWDDVFGRR